MSDSPQVARPTPKTRFRVIARDRQVLRDWETMLRTRREVAIRCWDHLSMTPAEPIGSRYIRLKGDLSTCVYRGRSLPQWQWELDNRGRVKVGVGEDFVVILDVSMGHPRGNE